MNKKQKIQFLFVFVLIVSFLFAFKLIWKQEKLPKIIKQQITEEYASTTQIENACMKPAWYRFFVPQDQKVPEVDLTNPKLHFLIEKNNTQANLLNVTLLNTTEQNVLFPIENRSLLMLQEAKDPHGNWKAIEYWNRDWQMGKNTKEEFTLEKNKKIFCTAPQYVGDFETEIRFKLKIIEANFTEKIVYSPKFIGSINLGQFNINWEKETRLKPENVCYLDK